MPKPKQNLNLSALFGRRWYRATAKRDTDVGVSGLTVGQRRTRFLKAAPARSRSILANQQNRRPLTPNEAVAFIKAHAMVLTNAKTEGELMRLSKARHDIIGLTLQAIQKSISAKDRPQEIKTKGKPLRLRTLTGEWSRIANLLIELRDKENTTNAIRRQALQRTRGLSAQNSIAQRDEINALNAIANATNDQLRNALKQRGKMVEVSESTPINLSGPVKSLVQKILRHTPVNTTLEFRNRLVKALTFKEYILELSRLGRAELEKELINHGVLPPERRR